MASAVQQGFLEAASGCAAAALPPLSVICSLGQWRVIFVTALENQIVEWGKSGPCKFQTLSR